MCRNITAGARRCPCDTSAARRQRRKLNQLTSRFPTQTNLNNSAETPPLNPYSNLTLEECVSAAQNLKQKLTLTPELTSTNKETHYQELELELTHLGTRLGELADEKTSLTVETINERNALKKAEIYADTAETTKIKEEIEALKQEYILLFEDEPEQRFEEDEKEFLDEEFIEVHDKYWAKQDELTAHIKTCDEMYDKYRNEQAKTFFEEHRKAYSEILATIRPLGGEVQVKAEPEVKELFKQTVAAFYPTDWIESSNNSEKKLNVIETEARGEYSHNAVINDNETYKGVIEETTRPSMGYFQLQAGPDDTPEEEQKVRERFKNFISNLTNNFSEREQADWRSLNGRNIHILNFFKPKDEEIYDTTRHGELINGEPAGEGWVKKQSLASLAGINAFVKTNPNASTEEIINHVMEEKWVRDLKLKTKQGVSEIKIPTSETDQKQPKFNNNQQAVLFHEFGHRIENINPHIPKMEKAFLSRRANKTENNWFNNMIPSLGPWNAEEVSHNANMIDPYMSKEYGTGESYEVLTTGLEAIYGGNYGGLVGLHSPGSQPKADLDHRGFILGLLATT